MRPNRLGISAVVGLAAALLAPAAPARAAARVKLVVLGIEAVDDGDPVSQEKTASAAKNLTDALRVRASAARARFEPMPNANRELAEVKLVSGCLDEGRDCMVAIGKQLGAERVIYGKLERKSAGNYTMTLRLLNVTGRQVEKTLKNYQVPGSQTNPDGAKQIATELFTQLTGVQLTAGAVVVRANVETGTAKITGGGSAPIVAGVARIEGVPEGPAELVVESEGHEATTQQIEITGGELRVEVTLEKSAEEAPPIKIVETPPEDGVKRPSNLNKTLFWVAAGTTVVGAGVWVWSWQKINSAESDIDSVKGDWTVETGQAGMDACELAKLPGESSDPQAERVRAACDDGASYQTINRFVGVPLTLVGLAASGYFLYKGYLSGEAASGETPRDAKRRQRLVFAPEVYPEGGGGAAALFTF